MLPVAGLRVQFGFVPNPVAVNCCVPDGLRLAILGLTLIVGPVEVFKVILADAVCAGFAMLATVSTIV
jgi:hypothetical protein